MLFPGQDKQYLDSILSDAEQESLRQFNENELMREAVRKILLLPIYTQGTLKPGQHPDMTRNFAIAVSNRRELSDEQLGQQTRAVIEAFTLLESGFSYLATFKTEEKVEEKKNPAR